VFLPVSDNNRRIWISYHYVTLALIAANVAVFTLQTIGTEDDFNRLMYGLGMIPAVVTGDARLDPGLSLLPPALTLLTSMFLHGGIGHLAGNMLFLWVFGDNIEDSMGHGRFLGFYLLSGVIASLVQIMVDAGSQVPVIGASGAVSGILGAYFVLHPRVQVWVLAFAIIPVRLPTFVVLGLWIGMQLVMSLTTAEGEPETVAWWAHIGGFFAGAALIRYFRYPHVPLWDTSKDGELKVGGLRFRGRTKGSDDA